MAQGEVGTGMGQFANWSPIGRITLFVILATLTGLFCAIVGVAIAWAWISLEHEMPLEFSRFPPKYQFAISATVITVSYPPLALLTFAFMRRVTQGSLDLFGVVRRNWLKDLAMGSLLGASFVGIMFAFYALTNLVRFEPAPQVN